MTDRAEDLWSAAAEADDRGDRIRAISLSRQILERYPATRAGIDASYYLTCGRRRETRRARPR
jgi:hypothetical protein